VARRRGARSTGRSLAALGYAASMAAGWLGGNLVYGQKVGVDHTASEKLPEEFTPVLSESSVDDGKPVRAEHNGTPILLVRRGSQIYALAETCSHLGGPLSEGKLDGDVIQCPWHGSRFSIRDGHVVDGPAVHAALFRGPRPQRPGGSAAIGLSRSNRNANSRRKEATANGYRRLTPERFNSRGKLWRLKGLIGLRRSVGALEKRTIGQNLNECEDEAEDSQ
jgi:nitrite reductase/ring-hydroxylating ferredoxin subunit